MTKPREPNPRPHIRCAICGRGHNQARTVYCGNPCSPRVAVIVALISERPRGVAEIIRELPQYALRQGRIKQIMAPLVARKIIYKTRERNQGPTVYHKRPHDDRAVERAQTLYRVRCNRIGQSNRTQPRRKPQPPKEVQS